ncbi:MAG: glycyl-tRNA synthetase beta chain [Acidimicrobiales bacterium]|nr:glycyl-tRNA synthetase beta chain [Acidimicrobiales bacterium]
MRARRPGSLAAIGIDVAAHDIRFVEDNWESPALGAWGLGWEVWLDGQEITQFTYFQQAGGLVLDPPATEITYGMERILMALHAVDHFKDIPYTDTLSYGELFGQNEFEWSTFYLDTADIDLLRRQFVDFEAEARRLVEARLPIPAHAQLLKCSHTFNVLDSRKAMGTTERASAFSQMRSLAHDVAELWLASREGLGHPLGRADGSDAPEAAAPAAAPATSPSPFFLELGTEELPAADVDHAIALLRAEVPKRLEAARLAHGAVTVIGTPRRLIVTVADVAANQADVDQVVRGPKVSAAFDAEGKPTRAAEGFAASRGTTVDALARVTEGANEHLAFESHEAGRPAAEVLAEVVPGLLDGLRFGRNMRWRPGSDAVAFSRPVRWLAVLLGSEVVPATWGGLAAGRTTRLFRSTGAPDATYADAATAVHTLEGAGIVADPAVRRAAIVEGALALAASVGGTVDTDRWARLVDEVVNLVEDPTPVLGSFRQEYLDLPPEVLTSVMTKHQRYLPVSDADGALLPHFVTVANGSIEPDVVRRGNQAVIEARYADAAFFVARDLATPVEQFAAELSSLTFDNRLGSVRDRVERIAGIGLDLAAALDIGSEPLAVVQQAGPLVKFDLASSMVIEMSSLAGTMALHYARAAGLPEPVATAVFEAELPRSSGDVLPSTLPGAVLALSDRFDLITALFSIGAEPTGSADPYGLRRAARGLLVIAMSGIDPALERVSISAGIERAAAHLPDADAADLVAKISPFVEKRFTQTLAELGFRHDLVRAAMVHGDHPARVLATLRELVDEVDTPEFTLVADALKRSTNLLADTDRAALPAPAPARFEAGSATVEQNLLDALAAFAPSRTGLAGFVQAAAPVATALNAFVDAVKVNADDPAVRANRLALVAGVEALGQGIVAWSEIE